MKYKTGDVVLWSGDGIKQVKVTVVQWDWHAALDYFYGHENNLPSCFYGKSNVVIESGDLEEKVNLVLY